jgi:hypothetical protein
VESLLAAHEQSDGILDGDLGVLAEEIVGEDQRAHLAGRTLGSYQLISLLV